MRFWTVLSVALLSSPAYSEVVQTVDGRRIDLKSDGTYEVLTAETKKTNITSLDPYMTYYEGEYGAKSVRFMPAFSNESEKTIVGIKFTSVFKSAFGDEIFRFSGESSEKILPKKKSSHEVFYYFEDNQFIGDEPYDKLQVFLGSGTGAVETAIDAVVFEGGEVVKITP